MLPFSIVDAFPSFTQLSLRAEGRSPSAGLGLQVLFAQPILCESPDRHRPARRRECLRYWRKLLKTTPMVRNQKPVYLDMETTLDFFWVPGQYSRSNYWMNISSLFLPEPSEVSLSGRVRDDAMKKLLAKQMGTFAETAPRFDVETGTIKGKKQRKEKTPIERASQELKTFEKKWLSLCTGKYFGCKVGDTSGTLCITMIFRKWLY